MTGLQGAVGEVRMTLEVTRKDTGKVDRVELVGFVDAEKLKQLQDDGLLPQPEGT